jgi:2-polyprenyl-6-methoxyphenol hydroxylase-like FAD-dependent oxidoreductase
MGSSDRPSSASTHAVVIGAGIAGLVTARVLTDHFDRVTLLERDNLPEGPEFRVGVPQESCSTARPASWSAAPAEVYGQGMTVAAESAVALGHGIEEHRARRPRQGLTGFARVFQRRLARLVFAPWTLATGDDLQWPETEGERPGFLSRLAQRYTDHVLHLATEDARAHQVFLEVQQGLRPPEALFQPAIAAKVLRRAIRPRP